MTKDGNKTKTSDEMQNKNSPSRDETRINAYMQAAQENKWLNLTLRYGTAILVVVFAFLLYGELTVILGPGLPTYILFYPAIIIVALLGGLGPGILATLLSVILTGIWILPPPGQISLKSPVDSVGAVLFTIFGIIISSVAELYRRNRDKAAAYDQEQALRGTRLEKEFLANILQHASQPFAIGYPDGRLGLHNSAFEDLTGYTTEELNAIDWSNKLTPMEWREMEQHKLDELNRTGQPVRYEKEYIRKDGSRVPIEMLVNVALGENGAPKYYYSFLTDITERKKAEIAIKQQADLIGLSHDAIVVWELDNGIESWNRGAKALYGYSESEAIGNVTHSLLSTNFPVPWSEIRAELLDSSMWEGELKHSTKDGQEVIVSARLQLITRKDGQKMVLETNRDITPRKKAEEKVRELLEGETQLTEELQTSNEELQVANEELINQQDELQELIKKLEISNRELEQFAYVASHDLQEPLRMVSSFTQLLEMRYKDKLDKDADEFIQFIVEGANRMKDLIDDLLAFSRLNTEAKPFESVNMGQSVNAVISYLKPGIEESNAEIIVDLLPTVMGDSSQIRQLFQNLISNAIKFRRDKPPQIHISAQDLGNEWKIGVSDNGIGIGPEHQRKIFEIFKRLHTRKEYAGTGIGLAICKRIVDRHGGRIWVESEEGKGSTFYFTIPK